MDQDDRKAADDIARAEDQPGEAEAYESEEGEGEAPDTFELELDGQVHTLPAALKGAFLRQADYTRKTQELAEHRRALESERMAVAEQAQAHDEALSDRAHLAALDQHLQDFAELDWRRLAEVDPHRAEALWARFQHASDLRNAYAHAVARHAHGRRIDAAARRPRRWRPPARPWRGRSKAGARSWRVGSSTMRAGTG
ncbi:hypothetical protein [Phenylobacterium soli]|uniref:Uncharacterized protein n=1 Tax=Phenylobacterium soli TaxID=2170551 RepID=A0A328AKG6_9CAUL|nr:hypothetical protein [Phenylobacterium soli]RAK54885.1 hypothetical protein DJ017_10280 [Phenylobacterium soli]